MTLHVNFFAQFNHTGVGRHCENAYFAMLRHRPAGISVEYCNNGRDESIRRLYNAARRETDLTLFFGRASSGLSNFPSRTVFWWFFESDRIPRRWLEESAPFDRIWAPSGWARDVLVAHQVAPERIQVVESGVNTRIYAPAPTAHEGFIFLSVGKYEGRKSIDETVEAFGAEFPASRYPDVQLWLKADFPMFPDRVRKLAENCAHDARIRVISGIFSDEQMASLYNSADAFVFPSKAEGFGLPLLEAIACGLPCITTHVSAQTIFLDHMPGLYIPVDFTVAPIVDPDYSYFYANDYAGEGFGNWALPSVDSIRHAMRDVYEHHDAWREKGLQAGRVIREAFSWDAIGRKALLAVQA